MSTVLGFLPVAFVVLFVVFAVAYNLGRKHEAAWWKDATKPFDRPVKIEPEFSIEQHGDAVTITTKYTETKA